VICHAAAYPLETKILPEQKVILPEQWKMVNLQARSAQLGFQRQELKLASHHM
jgi:hypothetical protein